MYNMRLTGLILIAGLTLIAITGLLASNANAGVVAYSTLQITDVRVTAGGGQIGAFSSISGTSSSRASFDGAPGVAWSDPADTPMSCVGDCGGIAENDFSQVSAGNPGLHFARGDAILAGSIPTGDAAALTVAETQLTHQAGSSADGEVSTTSTFTTINFMPPAEDITLEFDAFGELFAESTDADGFAQANFEWSLILSEQDPMTMAYFFTHASIPLDLNRSVAISGIGSDSYSVANHYLLTVSGLQANTNYRLQISQSSDVEAALPVPATMAILGVGLIGLGAAARRRKRIA